MIKFYAKSQDEAEISIYGDIGESMWGESKSASQFKKELDNLGDVKNIKVSVQSSGGSVFDALAIYNMLKRHKAYITVYIDGLAASAASFLAMAADKLIMPINSYLMVHNASGLVIGNKEEFRKTADILEKIDGTIASIYAEKTKQDNEKIVQMMECETWMNGQEAFDLGFSDVLEVETKIAASIDNKFISQYLNIPETLKNSIPETIETYREVNPQPVAIDKPKEEPEKPDISAQTAEFNKLRLKILGGN